MLGKKRPRVAKEDGEVAGEGSMVEDASFLPDGKGRVRTEKTRAARGGCVRGA